jgi:hypothetical protein
MLRNSCDFPFLNILLCELYALINLIVDPPSFFVFYSLHLHVSVTPVTNLKSSSLAEILEVK